MSFQVGEIATLIWTEGSCRNGADRYIGSDVEIIELLHKEPTLLLPVYTVMTSDGKPIHVTPPNLRKKRPPQETSSWTEIQKITKWNPVRETV